MSVEEARKSLEDGRLLGDETTAVVVVWEKEAMSHQGDCDPTKGALFARCCGVLTRLPSCRLHLVQRINAEEIMRLTTHGKKHANYQDGRNRLN